MRYPYPMIPMNVLEQWLAEDRPLLLIDLRSRQEYGQSHLRGAVNIPLEELESRVAELPEDRPLVFYCGRGSKSMRACNFLGPRGYRVVDVASGIAFYRGPLLER